MSLSYFEIVALDRPLLCRCGGLAFTYGFERFPMEHVGRCDSCGAEMACGIKLTKPREWVNGYMDPDTGYWHKGHFKE